MQSVLVIDDSADIHALLAVRLRGEGLLLDGALDAEEGLRKAVAEPPDLILLDLDLGTTSGFEVCAQLQAHPVTSLIPVIFLSGETDVAQKVRGFDLGGVDYVTKPFDAAELKARVRAALRTKRYQDLLTIRAQVDALTGLKNRAYFDARLADEVEAAKRYRRHVSLLLLDLDHFKRLNDDYGHPFGDRVLQAMGDCLLSTARVTDSCCRYGGEEFGVILSETTAAQAVVAAERIRQRMGSIDLSPRGSPVKVTASMGLAATEFFADLKRLTPGALVDRADAALYEAKRAGRDRLVRSDAVPGEGVGRG